MFVQERLRIRFTIIVREQFNLSVHDGRAWSAAQAPLLRKVRCARRAGGEHSPDLRLAVAIEPCADNYLSLERRS
jgi:hypothetical protein